MKSTHLHRRFYDIATSDIQKQAKRYGRITPFTYWRRVAFGATCYVFWMLFGNAVTILLGFGTIRIPEDDPSTCTFTKRFHIRKRKTSLAWILVPAWLVTGAVLFQEAMERIAMAVGVVFVVLVLLAIRRSIVRSISWAAFQNWWRRKFPFVEFD